jgi:peptidoglycan/LPS O-acetylase OafA/YrhL
MHPTAALLGDIFGYIVGGVIWGYLFGLLAGMAFKRMEPDERAVAAALCAWVILSIVAGFGFAHGNGFRFDAGFRFVPGLAAAFFLLRRHYRRLWTPDEA